MELPIAFKMLPTVEALGWDMSKLVETSAVLAGKLPCVIATLFPSLSSSHTFVSADNEFQGVSLVKILQAMHDYKNCPGAVNPK